MTGSEQRSQEQARRLAQMQSNCQQFADEYAGKVLETVGPITKRTTDQGLVSQLLYWELTQLNSAYTIATGSSPILCSLDFVVLASLSRMVIEDTLVARDDVLLAPLPAIYRDLEQQAWAGAARTLNSAQQDELRRLIGDWRVKNPHVVLVGFVHFAEFAEATGANNEAQHAPGSLFGLIGLDPFAGLDPAVRQIEQSRQLAQRVTFYMQRVPYLLDLQASRTVAEATMAPQVQRANASMERASLAMTDYAKIGAGLPDALAREREALIRQLSGELLGQEAELRDLLTQMQATLATGSDTAAAVNSAVTALDRLMARFPDDASGAGTSQGRPFDITEYTAAAAQFAGTARQLTILIDALGREGAPAADAMNRSVETGRGLVDYLFWRALLLGLLLLASALAAAIAYRALAQRLGVSRRTG